MFSDDDDEYDYQITFESVLKEVEHTLSKDYPNSWQVFKEEIHREIDREIKLLTRLKYQEKLKKGGTISKKHATALLAISKKVSLN